MSETFAKIFESEKHGQILVKVDESNTGVPEVRYFFKPEELGICSMAVSFSDTDDGWSSADRLFDTTTIEEAENVVMKIKMSLGI